MKNALLSLLLCLACSNLSVGQPAEPERGLGENAPIAAPVVPLDPELTPQVRVLTQPADRNPQPVSLGNPASSDASVDVMKAELAVHRDYTEKMSDAVYFTLTTAIGILIVLIGANWWQVKVLYDRDKAALTKEIHDRTDQKIEKAVVTLARETQNAFDEKLRLFDETAADAVDKLYALTCSDLMEIRCRNFKELFVEPKKHREAAYLAIHAVGKIQYLEIPALTKVVDTLNEFLVTRTNPLDGSLLYYLERLAEKLPPSMDAAKQSLTEHIERLTPNTPEDFMKPLED